MRRVLRRYICECPNHVGKDRRTAMMTDIAYRRRTRYGRLLYCGVCEETEPPRVIRKGRVTVEPASWVSLLGEVSG